MFSGRSHSGLHEHSPILFHSTRGSNVQLSADKSRATRTMYYCKGICFSNRPVSIGELVSIRINDVSTNWKGVARFGFTKHDPAKLKSAKLPSYVLPDLVKKPGYWAEEIPPRFAECGTVLSFQMTSGGDVRITVNGEDSGYFFGEVDTNGPVWAIVDIYANTISVEFVEERHVHNISRSLSHHGNGGRSRPSGGSTSTTHYGSTGTRNAATPLDGATHTSAQSSATAQSMQQRHLPSPNDITLPFHATTGRNVLMSRNKTIAQRLPNKLSNGYAFTERPVQCGETLVIQITSILPADDGVYIGGLAFGMTTCDPADLTSGDLPDDSDLLLDRLEYWIVNKDVCLKPQIDDKLSFHLTPQGEVQYEKNGHKMSTLMHVDNTLAMWMFFDVHGSAQAIKLCGIVDNVVKSQSTETQLSRLDISAESGVSQHDPDECKVCMDHRVDCVLSPCGHVALCYDCAVDIKESEHDSCPICRSKIEIITKMYRT
ncbi:Protein neuralized [Lamellibrachia satsuma]|nr:Protein neuralized [Lamellibrachia satsuma]